MIMYLLHFSESEAWLCHARLGLSIIIQEAFEALFLRHSGSFHGTGQMMLSCGHLVSTYNTKEQRVAAQCSLQKTCEATPVGEIAHSVLQSVSNLFHFIILSLPV